MVELADTAVLRTASVRSIGSSPITRTTRKRVRVRFPLVPLQQEKDNATNSSSFDSSSYRRSPGFGK